MLPLSPAIFITELDPIIITSPTIRSGTTLLQRLLCSATNALIYGETCAQDLEFFLTLYPSKAMMYNIGKHAYAASLDKVQGGDVNDWLLDLMPDIDGYLAQLGRCSFALLDYCRDYAVTAGRPIWGLKAPGFRPHTIALIRQAMPRSRFIYIHRDVVDCLRSAKAKQAVCSEQEVKEFCNLWADNLRYALSLSQESSIFLLNYAEFMAEPGASLQRIAAFSGAQGMKPEVLGRKINARPSDAGASASGYIEPATLTDAEMQIVSDLTAPLREQLYE
jgi:hypothetical protein